MKYKAIALDLDGTLKNSQQEIMPETRKILIQLQKKGVKVVLASGRPTWGMQEEAKELLFDQFGGYTLSFNGACIQNCTTKEIVYNATLEKELAHRIYKQAKAYHLSVVTYKDDTIITEDGDDTYVQLEARINRMPIKEVSNLIDEIDIDVNKVLLTGDPAYMEKVLDPLSKAFPEVWMYRSNPYFIEVMPHSVDKASSLGELIKILKIKQESLIVFGDGYNDVSMIRYAGLGVAMGNAVAEAKEVAAATTSSNDDEGIANYLHKLQKAGEI